MNNTTLQEPKVLEHLPFCLQAIELGKASREMDHYARTMQRWARFFATQARETQETYQKVREEFLLVEAGKNRVKVSKKPRDLTISSSPRARREKALEDLISVGLSQTEAAKIRATL